jgi:tripartite-type tricarboxylate transporter receptor subunit TctC
MPTGIGYSHWLAPEVPADRIAALRAAYQATLADATLLDEAKQRGIEIKPKTPEQIAQLVKAAADTPADVRDKTVKILGWE